MMGTLRDISHINQAQEELERKVNQRTRELKIKNRQLEELNTALKVLLAKEDEDQKSLQESILYNLNKLILPNLEKAKENSIDDHHKQYLGILESNLKDIVSPFIKTLSSTYKTLTPAEIRVADMVKHGKRTKEIATLLNLSIKTIESHRGNIRKKLGIKNKKTNLRSYLSSR
jgi:DNA-binding CsgD family transcriptional regulator